VSYFTFAVARKREINCSINHCKTLFGMFNINYSVILIH
jgi:hypothetical protein